MVCPLQLGLWRDYSDQEQVPEKQVGAAVSEQIHSVESSMVHP